MTLLNILNFNSTKILSLLEKASIVGLGLNEGGDRYLKGHLFELIFANILGVEKSGEPYGYDLIYKNQRISIKSATGKFNSIFDSRPKELILKNSIGNIHNFMDFDILIASFFSQKTKTIAFGIIDASNIQDKNIKIRKDDRVFIKIWPEQWLKVWSKPIEIDINKQKISNIKNMVNNEKRLFCEKLVGINMEKL